MDADIIIDLKNSYGIYCEEIAPVFGGWLNKKWKVLSNKGLLLIKKFSSIRFDKAKLMQIEIALQRQVILNKNGVRCPHIFLCNNRVIRILNDDTAYMVMEFCSGKIESCDTITYKQLNDLATVCALMHREFSKLPLQNVNLISGKKIMDGLWSNYHKLLNGFYSNMPDEYKKLVLAHKNILCDIKMDFLNRLPKSIAHEDFSADNILFNEDGVSAIIDFDRNQYSYVWHDIGRAILSFALKDNKLIYERVCAFAQGYNLNLSDIIDALRITWFIEAIWWIQPEIFMKSDEKLVRFRKEIKWLTDNWFELDSLVLSGNK